MTLRSRTVTGLATGLASRPARVLLALLVAMVAAGHVAVAAAHPDGPAGQDGPGGPAHPAASAPLAYSCQVWGQTRTFTGVLDTDVPARLAFGQTVAATVALSMTVPEDVTATFRDDVRAAAIDGTANVAGKIGSKKTPWSIGLLRTALPPSGSLVLVGSVPTRTFSGTEVGRVWRLRAGDLTADLRFYRADGQPTSPIPAAAVTCTLPADQVPLIRKVVVVKDATTTTVVGRDTAKGDRGKARIAVASTFGTRARGEVRVKLFHRGALVTQRVLALEKGVAKLKTRRLRQRGWSVTAKYLGSAKLRGSRGTDKIKLR